jgi:undecaprenyl pyrophosphate phosphatase UppP
MNWTSLKEKELLDRAFLLGVIGISLAVIPLMASGLDFNLIVYAGWFNGLGIAAQLVAMSLAVLVIRKRKVTKETQQKAKQMTMVLAVSLLFFFLV